MTRKNKYTLAALAATIAEDAGLPMQCWVCARSAPVTYLQSMVKARCRA